MRRPAALKQRASFALYASVGAVATLAHAACMVLLVERAGVPAWLASALGAFVGAQVAFVGHALLTFSVRPPWGRAWGRFQFTAAGGALLGIAIVAAGVRLGWHYLVAQGVATALVLCTGFVLNARWTFGAPRQSQPAARKAAPAPRPPR